MQDILSWLPVIGAAVVIAKILFDTFRAVVSRVPKWWWAWQLRRKPYRKLERMTPDEINALWSTDDGRREINAMFDSVDVAAELRKELKKGPIDLRPKWQRDRDKRANRRGIRRRVLGIFGRGG